MIEHVDDGAFGLVLNRPSDATVGDAVPRLSDVIASDAVVHMGGPVQPEGVVALGEFDDPDESPKLVVGDVGMVDLESPPPGLGRVRLFAGHAGWGAGQLDGELEQESWIISDPTPEDPFSEGDLWTDALRRMGGEFELVARMPPDPSVN